MAESARLRDIALGRRDTHSIDPRVIKIDNGFNPRNYSLQENREHLDGLKASIKQVGVLVPLLVRWDGEQAVLIDGECRLRASLELIAEGVEIKSVPVLQEKASDEAQRLLIAIASNKGKPLSLLESGGAYSRLVRFGWGISDIATKVGVSERHVKDALELFDSPREVKELVASGSVTPALAKQAVRKRGDKAGTVLKEAVEAAKAKGQTTAKREREPKQQSTPVQQAIEHSASRLEEAGDRMADLIGDLPADDVPGDLARAMRVWNKMRGRG